MAPLPVIHDVYRVALNWVNTVTTDRATNVIHISKASSSPSAVATELDAKAAAGMWIPMVTSGVVDNLVVTPLDGSSASYTFFTGRPTKWRGAGSAGDYIPQACALVKLITARRGRSYRGRVFLPWVCEAEQSNGTLTAADVTTWTAAWVTWLAALVSDGYHPVVASYLLSTAEDVVAVTGESRIATQRRRLVR